MFVWRPGRGAEMAGSENTITVMLGDLHDHVEARVRSGRYASASDVLRAALRALDREECDEDEVLKRKVALALDDPRPSIPADQVFSELKARRIERAKAAEREI